MTVKSDSALTSTVNKEPSFNIDVMPLLETSIRLQQLNLSHTHHCQK